jgi:hypothetical protein
VEIEGLRERRCRNHPSREAAGRCPECGFFFCRECVTEHEDRILCSDCLRRKALASGHRGRGWLRRIAAVLSAAAGLAIAWLFFFLLGRGLLLRTTALPESASSPSPMEPAR